MLALKFDCFQMQSYLGLETVQFLDAQVWKQFKFWMLRFGNISIFECLGLETFTFSVPRFGNISVFGCLGFETFGNNQKLNA